MRKLTAKEVEFELTIESEDLEVRGNATASGDDAADKEVEDEIIERLDRGDIEAWCYILVKATWNGYKGHDSLGGCSFAAGSGDEVRRQVEETAGAHDMYQSALDALNEAIARDVARVKEIEAMLPESEEESASA